MNKSVALFFFVFVAIKSFCFSDSEDDFLSEKKPKTVMKKEQSHPFASFIQNMLRESETDNKCQAILKAIKNKTLSITKTMNDLKTNKITLTQLPDLFFNYHSPETYLHTSDLTPLMWLVLSVRDHYFNDLLTNSPITPGLLRSINDRNFSGYTALIVAIININSYGSLEVVKFLLDNGADPNLKSYNGITPLSFACNTINTNIRKTLIGYLLDAKADPNAQGPSPLIQIIRCSNNGVWGVKDEIKMLLDAHADPNIQDDIGNTPLVYAAEISDLCLATVIVSLLLDAKANPNTVRKDGSTALIFALKKSNTKVVQLLLDAKADPNIILKEGLTPLLLAIRQQACEDLIEILLKAGANPNLGKTEDDSTALILAVQKDNAKMVQELLEAKADVNRSLKSGFTPLMLASEKGNVTIVQLLLEAKADPNLGETWDGATALILAVQKDNAKMVQLLLEAKADVNKRLKSDFTPLMLAAERSNITMVQLLLEAKADPNLTAQGKNALLLALGRSVPIVTALFPVTKLTLEQFLLLKR